MNHDFNEQHKFALEEIKDLIECVDDSDRYSEAFMYATRDNPSENKTKLSFETKDRNSKLRIILQEMEARV